jgi:citrate synthase
MFYEKSYEDVNASQNSSENDDSVFISVRGKKIELQSKKPTIGNECIDISNLLKHGFFTLDTGFVSTASCESEITYIDGDEGILLYRGYDIEDVSTKLSFTETFYLLMFGDIPNLKDSQEFDKKIVNYLEIPQTVLSVIESFDRDSHPMSIMMAAISNLSSHHHIDFNPKNKHSILENCLRVVSQTMLIGVLVNRYISNKKFIEPKKDINFIQNFVHLMFSDNEIYKQNEILERAFDKILILHADHEQNASTSTVRLIGSTEANVYASVVGGFAALWGPLHGGANEAVIKMIEQIAEPENINDFIEKVKDKNSATRLMGFGHRVYKNYDPRATVLKSSCDEVLKIANSQTAYKSLQIAKQLETIALSDDYFKSRKLFPNVDFYSGIIYKACEIDTSFFTVLFGIARTAGWTSQLFEALSDPNRKICRPRQLYKGSKKRFVAR